MLNKKYKINATKKRDLIGIVFFKATANNTIATLTDLSGNTVAWCSSGSAGFKNARKSTSYAGQAAAEKLAKKAKQIGYQVVTVKMKGFGFGKELAIKGLKKGGLWVKKIEDTTPVIFNGCRQPKKRRI